jgi:hypothetical protein
MSSDVKIETLKLKPSECAMAIRAMFPTHRSVFMWGPPGISKSQTVQQVAKAEAVGFIDVRLAQMDPTDLRGIPYPVNVNGVHGVRWSAPLVLPRDVDFDMISEIEAEATLIRFENPLNAEVVIQAHAIGKHCSATIHGHRVTRNDTFPDAHGTVHPDAFTVEIIDTISGETVGGKVHWTVTGKVRGILALEEFNSAPMSVQAAAYQLVLDRKLGEYRVPDGVFIIALGNRDSDKAITYKMPTPIMNRFIHIEMYSDFDDWLVWALNHRIHPEVVGYLSAFKESLYHFEPGTASRGFPTPRSWEFVSDILNTGIYMTDQVALGLITGAVGDAEGAKFMAFRKIAHALPRADDILSGRLAKLPKKVEVQLAYALTTTLCYALKSNADDMRRKVGDEWRTGAERDRWLQEADNFIEFIMANFQPEICVMGLRSAITIHRLPFETTRMKHFNAFADRFKDLIVS